jgi:hypothetical protein
MLRVFEAVVNAIVSGSGGGELLSKAPDLSFGNLQPVLCPFHFV